MSDKKTIDLLAEFYVCMDSLHEKPMDYCEAQTAMDMASAFYLSMVNMINSSTGSLELKWCSACEVDYVSYHKCIEGIRDE